MQWRFATKRRVSQCQFKSVHHKKARQKAKAKARGKFSVKVQLFRRCQRQGNRYLRVLARRRKLFRLLHRLRGAVERLLLRAGGSELTLT
ncbi:MAG: hypothetical protein A2428_10730 [Bdellovibrionales bacterium RIFOXYC1_FULL_54_43]|nr:MAG: hypothetical protein A2428_10730 [Bdellovibrionales bacterium RIFOXYC1_FULL_54_43]OFZ78350.1 MAG: hypothetical protein A2603_12495 [Bdellovibrionales bacterium RIFOXYD1_FULL_55_31]